MTSDLAERPARDVTVAHEPPDSPLAMLSAALASGQDPEKLHRLMDLAERWKAERAAEAFAAALNAAQAEMPCIVKDKSNTHLNTKYATLENINATIRPVYTRHGFSISYGTEDSKLPNHMRIVCDLRHVGGHTQRYFLDTPVDVGNKAKTAVQAAGSTLSYARRYLLLMAFNLTVADEDVDGRNLDELEKITDADALEVEDAITDSGANRDRFLQWCHEGNHLVGDERLIANIRKTSLPAVLDVLKRKKAGPAK